jgi:transcriptional regulator with XRE-family HTH domain
MTTKHPLYRLRRTRELTQDELARRTGIERSKLSRAERGYSSLHPEELRRLARVLRVKVVDLNSETQS